MDALVETWQINNRVLLYLLDAIPEEHLALPLAKGKTVGGNFSHVHNVRLMWLKSSAPELWEGQTKLENEPPTKETLAARLTESGAAIEALLRKVGTTAGRIKGFKPHATAFVGYLVSHETHHRAMVEIALRQNGVPLPDKIAYGLWEWGTR